MTDEELINYNYTGVTKHPKMSMQDRAAQFAPFESLSGMKEKYQEEIRTTEEKMYQSEEQMDAINAELIILNGKIKEKPEVRVRYFEKDMLKEGGSYKTIIARINKIDEVSGLLVLDDNKKIRINDIFELTENV